MLNINKFIAVIIYLLKNYLLNKCEQHLQTMHWQSIYKCPLRNLMKLVSLLHFIKTVEQSQTSIGNKFKSTTQLKKKLIATELSQLFNTY